MFIGQSSIQDFMKGAVSTVNGANGSYDPNGDATGLLSPAEVDGFSKMVMDSNGFLKEVDIELKTRVSGTIEELGSGRRLLRKKIEDTDNITGNEVKPIINQYGYRTVGMTLGTEISNDWYRQNRAREGFEEQFMGIISKQIGVDILDLGLNGNEEIDVNEEYSQLLSINDGWLKQLLDKIPPKQLVDGKTLNNGFFTDQYFYELKKKLPTRYFEHGAYKWICSSNTHVKVLEFLRNRQTAAGDAAIVGGQTLNPLSIPFTTPTGFPDDIIIFGDPKRLKVVWTYDVGMRRTTEGKELVAKDNRFYAWFFDNDYIVVNPGAFTMLMNVGEVLSGSTKEPLVNNIQFKNSLSEEQILKLIRDNTMNVKAETIEAIKGELDKHIIPIKDNEGVAISDAIKVDGEDKATQSNNRAPKASK